MAVTYTPVITGPLLEGDTVVAGYYRSDNWLTSVSATFTGDGTTTTFSGGTSLPIVPGSLAISVFNPVDSYTDDGLGNVLFGVSIVGTINYSNGSFSFTTPLGHTPVSGSAIIVTVAYSPVIAVLLDGIKVGELTVDTTATPVPNINFGTEDVPNLQSAWAWYYPPNPFNVDPAPALDPALTRRQRVDARAQVQGYDWSGLAEQIVITQYFRKNLINFVPPEFTYLDGLTGYNDLANFVQILAVTLDEVKDYIDSFVEIFDIDRCDSKYLPYIAVILGYSLNKTDSLDSQRRQLKNAVAWYKVKGTFESFRILFYSLGYTIQLWELWTEDYSFFFKTLPGDPPDTVADSVPPTDPRLIENGGTWYRSPHFAIEFVALGTPNLTAAGLRYIISRISQIRPAHTVLEYLEYLLAMEDDYELQDENYYNIMNYPWLDDGWYTGYCSIPDTVYVRSGDLFPNFPIFPTRNGTDTHDIKMYSEIPGFPVITDPLTSLPMDPSMRGSRSPLPRICNPVETLTVTLAAAAPVVDGGVQVVDSGVDVIS